MTARASVTPIVHARVESAAVRAARVVGGHDLRSSGARRADGTGELAGRRADGRGAGQREARGFD